MKKNIQKQFENIKSVIDTNIQTIKSLKEQSEGLENIIKSMANQEASATTKQNLEKIKSNVDKSIDTLFQETKELFVAFDNLVNELF